MKIKLALLSAFSFLLFALAQDAGTNGVITVPVSSGTVWACAKYNASITNQVLNLSTNDAGVVVTNYVPAITPAQYLSNRVAEIQASYDAQEKSEVTQRGLQLYLNADPATQQKIKDALGIQ